MNPKPAQRGTGKPAARKHPAPEKKAATDRSFRLDAIPGKYGLPLTLGLTALMILIVFYKFISGSLYYLFKDIGSDSINQMYPHLVLISRYLRTEGFPLWSFAQGMGQELMSSSLNDPFSLLVCLLPAGQVAYGFILMEIAKIFLTALIAYYFFRHWTHHPLILAAGALLYSFCGFMIIGGGWTIFSTEIVFFTSLLLAFENLYRRNSWYLFPVAVALIGMLRPFDLYIFSLFLIFYLLFRHFTSEQPTFRRLLVVSGRMVALGALGLAMSLFVFIPGLQIMLDSPRVAGTSGYFDTLLSRSVFSTESGLYYQTLVSRFFSNDLLGNGSLFKGWYNYLEAPLVYIGLLPLLMAPQVFHGMKPLHRIAYGAFLLLFVVASVFPFFRYAFWAFAGDYFRVFSIFPSLILLLYSIRALDGIREKQGINLVVLGITLATLLVLLYFPWKESQLIHGEQQAAVRNFLILYALLLGALKWIRSHTLWMVLVLGLVIMEVGYFNYGTVNNRDCLSRTEAGQKTGYNDYSVDAVAFLTERDRTFYRVHKDHTSDPTIHRSFNDAQIQGYYGTMSYSSFNQKYYIRFLEEMDLIKKGNEQQTRWATGLVRYPLLINWASTKYYLRTRPESAAGFPAKALAAFGDIQVSENLHYLPLGFTYGSYIPVSEFRKLPMNAKMTTLLKAAVLEDPADEAIRSRLHEFAVSDTATNYLISDYIRDVDSLRTDTLAMTSFSQNRIEGTIETGRPKLLFFSIPYDRGWHAEMDGKSVKPMLTNLGFIGLMAEPGKHRVVLFYRPPYFHISLAVSLTGILVFTGLAGFTIYRKRSKNQKNPSA